VCGLGRSPARGLPRVAHQRCWGAQTPQRADRGAAAGSRGGQGGCPGISQAASRREAEALAQQFGRRWQATSPNLVTCCGISPSCWPSSAVRTRSGDGGGRPTSSNGASWRSIDALARWCALSMCRVWSSGLSIRSSTGSIWSGVSTPFGNLHKRLDIAAQCWPLTA